MSTSKIIFTLFVFCNFQLSKLIAQEHDLGLSITSSKFERLIIDHKMTFKNDYSFTLGLSAGLSERKQGSEVAAWTFYYRLQRVTGEENKDLNLRLGLSKNLKNSNFALGANVILGYRNKLNYGYSIYSDYDFEDDHWRTWYMTNPIEKQYEFPYASSSLTRVKTHLIRIGIAPRLDATIPIFDRFYLNVFCSGYSGIISEVDRVVEADGLNDVPAYNPSTYLEFEFQCGAGIRYRIGETQFKRRYKLKLFPKI